MSTTLYHPTLADVTQEVDDSLVEEWTESGWSDTPPAPLDDADPATEPDSGDPAADVAASRAARGLPPGKPAPQTEDQPQS